MGIAIAVHGFLYTLSGVSEVSPNSAVITPAPSARIKAGGKGIYSGAITLTFPAGTLAATVFTASGTNTIPAVFTINPSKIKKTFIHGKTALGEGDISGQIMVAGLMISGTTSMPVTVPATVSISAAGQNKVSAG